MNIHSASQVSTLVPESTPTARRDAPAAPASETAPASVAPSESGGATAVEASNATQTDAPPPREPEPLPRVSDEPPAGDRPAPGSVLPQEGGRLDIRV